jgi:phosphomannomutase/phosphoglucomutase
MKVNKEIFREYDVRGVVQKDLTEDIIYHLGQAIGTLAISEGVDSMAVGRDCRLSSEPFAAALMRGLEKTGINITDIGLCATPMLYFSIRHLGVGGGVMVTGSHNPPDFNGFKICVGPDTIYGEKIQELGRIIEEKSYTRGAGKTVRRDISAAYQDYLYNNVKISSQLTVCVDGGNGVGGYFACPIIRRFGCTVHELYCDPDGNFPHHFPDPTIPANLEDLIKRVKETKAGVGIAYDGDADRLGVITNEGRPLWGDELLILFSRQILKKSPGAAIIGEVKCSQRLYDDIEKHGGRPIMWKAGHSLIKGKMKEEKALLAGEMSGHLFFADRYFGYDDAIYASLRLLEILSEAGDNLTDLLSDVPVSYYTPEIRVECPDELKFTVVREVGERLRKIYQIIDIDGVRIPFSDGWGLLRASNTQPVLVLRFEALSEKRLAEIRNTIEGTLRAVLAEHDIVS